LFLGCLDPGTHAVRRGMLDHVVVAARAGAHSDMVLFSLCAA
jgi:hypothetical protein